MSECYNCGFFDSDYGCTCPSLDMWYACPIESKKEENQKELEEYADWLETKKQIGCNEKANRRKVEIMSRDKAETIAYAIKKECQRSSLYDWCESWDITIDDFEEFLANGIKGSETE